MENDAAGSILFKKYKAKIGFFKFWNTNIFANTKIQKSICAAFNKPRLNLKKSQKIFKKYFIKCTSC